MEQRAFARAGSAAQGQELPAFDCQINAAQDFQVAAAHDVALAQAACDQQGPEPAAALTHGAGPPPVAGGWPSRPETSPPARRSAKAVPQMNATSRAWIEAGKS